MFFFNYATIFNIYVILFPHGNIIILLLINVIV